MPLKLLPSAPSLEHLKYQAKDLLKGLRDRHSQALALIREFHPEFTGLSQQEIRAARFSLSDAQLIVGPRIMDSRVGLSSKGMSSLWAAPPPSPEEKHYLPGKRMPNASPNSLNTLVLIITSGAALATSWPGTPRRVC
jgi:hypothetical protein